MKKLIFCLSLFLPFLAFSNIELNGLFRNDALWVNKTNNFLFSDVIENRLILSRKSPEWRFYSDIRIYLLYGEASKYNLSLTLPEELVSMGFPKEFSTNISLYYMLELKRAFIRYDSSYGMWTVGKTYINFGNPGLFNPFEFDKMVSFSDLKADKNGIFALEYQSTFWELSGFKSYISVKGEHNEPVYGGCMFTHVGSFDFGIVANRNYKNTNKAGVYFKGDIELGIYGAYAFHFDDHFTNNFSEANLGIDYSFLDGKLFTTLIFYYVEKGASSTNDYSKDLVLDKYLLAKYYIYGNFTYTPSEFLSFAFDGFFNLIDSSMLFTGSVRYSLSDGLDISLIGYIPAGFGEEEFSKDKLGNFGLTIRLEAKL